MNLRLDTSLTRGLGAELHVCEVQLLLRSAVGPLMVSATSRYGQGEAEFPGPVERTECLVLQSTRPCYQRVHCMAAADGQRCTGYGRGRKHPSERCGSRLTSAAGRAGSRRPRSLRPLPRRKGPPARRAGCLWRGSQPRRGDSLSAAIGMGQAARQTGAAAPVVGEALSLVSRHSERSRLGRGGCQGRRAAGADSAERPRERARRRLPRRGHHAGELGWAGDGVRGRRRRRGGDVCE